MVPDTLKIVLEICTKCTVRSHMYIHARSETECTCFVRSVVQGRYLWMRRRVCDGTTKIQDIVNWHSNNVAIHRHN